MDEEKRAADAAPSLEGLIRSSFPPLDPNGLPFSMILRGAAAELGDLRCTLSAHPNNAREGLQMLDQMKKDEYDVDKFGDINESEGMTASAVGHETSPDQQAETTAHTMNGVSAEKTNDSKKRGRDCEVDEEGSDDEGGEDDDIVDQEQLLLYIPSVTCTCSSWKMKDVSGEMLVTSLRVLFLPKNRNDGNVSSDDVAIDGRCIALHAVDSVPLSDDSDNHEREISHHHHVYCQLVEPTRGEDDMGCSSTMSTVAPAMVTDENNDTSCGDDENGEEVKEEDGSSEVDGDGSTVEVYFTPDISGERGGDGNGSQCDVICQSIFNSLTKLASLNPGGESDDGVHGGGGFFNMLSLMAGMGNGFSNGFDGEMVFANHDEDGDDQMVYRLGGSNNFVENEDESEMDTDVERQAMLRRLDDMLVVPPEYEIASSNDGQFDDADEEDEDDAEDDEIL